MAFRAIVDGMISLTSWISASTIFFTYRERSINILFVVVYVALSEFRTIRNPGGIPSNQYESEPKSNSNVHN